MKRPLLFNRKFLSVMRFSFVSALAVLCLYFCFNFIVNLKLNKFIETSVKNHNACLFFQSALTELMDVQNHSKNEAFPKQEISLCLFRAKANIVRCGLESTSQILKKKSKALENLLDIATAYADLGKKELCLQNVAKALPLLKDTEKLAKEEMSLHVYGLHKAAAMRTYILSFVLFLIVYIVGIYFFLRRALLSKLAHLERNIMIFETAKPDLEQWYPYHDEFLPVIIAFRKMVKRTGIFMEEIDGLKNYFKQITNAMPSILLAADDEGKITLWNKAAADFYRIPEEDALLKKIDEIPLLPQKVREAVKNSGLTKAETFTKETIAYEEQEKCFNFTIFPVNYNGFSVRTVRMDDVTDLERAERQLVQAHKMEVIGNLAGGLAHDFNNVLGAIITTGSLMKYALEIENKFDRSTMIKNIDTIETSASRATGLVKHLLSLSKNQENVFGEVDLCQSIEHVVKIIGNTLPSCIDLQVETVAKEAFTWADATQTEQIILNLCVNASHAMTIMRENESLWGGTLTIKLEDLPSHSYRELSSGETDGYWRISVADTGIGIPQDKLGQIFDPFYTTKEKGTGLGLSMVMNIIQRCQGIVEVKSEEGKGSVFCIILPKRYSQAGELPLLTKGNGQILLIDDDEILLNMGKDLLETFGYTALTAKTQHEALTIYKREGKKIKAVVLDMNLQETVGETVYIQLKKLNPELRCLFVSGYREKRRVEEALTLGVNGFIQKPYKVNEFISILNEICQ